MAMLYGGNLMKQNISNFQYVGYLSDFLATYNDIDLLTDQYNCAKENFDNANKAIKEYEETFSLKNCCIAWLIVFPITLLTLPLTILLSCPIFLWVMFCAVITSVIIVMSKIIYSKKVFPIHQAFLLDERSRAEHIYQTSYEKLVACRSNLRDLCGDIDEQCSYPLSIYLMREAAKEGECANIPQGIRYFKNRYKTLEISSDESAQALKKRIDNEQQLASKRRDFLEKLDEDAQTLFK